MTLKPWKILASTHLRDNIRLDRCELPNGQIIEGTVLEFGTWVTVLALTRQKDVVLIRQYRHGSQKVIVELPGGVMDMEDKSPLAAARRELQEETGYTSDRIVQVGCVSPNPANHSNLIYSFLALGTEKLSSQRLDETEEIEVFLKPLDEVIVMAKNGELLQSMQVSTLFFTLAYLNRIS
jgi:8-oxo-dGTP pyrophosphatase MutT (NUDIX family)